MSLKVQNRKAVALNGITFYHSQGHSVVTEGCAITFNTYREMELYINDRRKYWSELLNLELTISPDNHETLIEKDVMRVLELVCEKMDVDYDKAISKYRGGREVEARRFAMGICHRRKVQGVTIASILKLNHTSVTCHVKTLTDLCSVDASYRSLFLEVEDYVMDNISGRFLEDGSGQKLKT